jgi:diaminopimelate decarboxylase
MSGAPLRLAIVGQGPKGTFALERLLDYGAAIAVGQRVEVDLFEPHRVPGAGPVYDPGQPGYLRMNFPAGRIDMWAASSETVPASQRLPFTAWAREMGERVEAESYPPRALVGRYLAEGHETIVRHAPAQIEVELRRARVEKIRRCSASWELVSGSEWRTYDEVLIATGHESSWGESLRGSFDHPVPLIPSVFPVDERLSAETVAPGATVAVRGFGLSFIDAALALTEGRGGRFEPADHPYRLAYLSGRDDVARMLPFSRTGLAMLPKPSAGLGLADEEMERIAAQGRARILGLGCGFSFEDDLLGAIAKVAVAVLRSAHGGVAEGRWLHRARELLLGASRGEERRGGVDPIGEIERGLAIGAGLRTPDVEWAVGHGWRLLYPTLVERLGGDGLREEDWPSFQRLARCMERLAFGPAPLNAAKLLALIAAGRVDLSHVAGGRLASSEGCARLESANGSSGVDAVLDAVLPPPGAMGLREGLLGQLVRDGYARVAFSRRGLEVACDGGCIGSDGSLSRGLSAIGRSTEDSVIGNDTLDRTLHPLADRWAQRVIERWGRTGSGAARETALSV